MLRLIKNLIRKKLCNIEEKPAFVPVNPQCYADMKKQGKKLVLCLDAGRSGTRWLSESHRSTFAQSTLDRREAMQFILDHLPQCYNVIATTGGTGRELWQMRVEKNRLRFAMQGSMGCAPAIALGMLQADPKKYAAVFDGDGALLMKLGTLASIGTMAPENLLHVVFDNACYDSTGGQPTASKKIMLEQIAKTCGYRIVHRVDNLNDIEIALKDMLKSPGPNMLNVLVHPSRKALPTRPSSTPVEMATRFRSDNLV